MCLYVSRCENLTSMKGLPNVRTIFIYDCINLENVDEIISNKIKNIHYNNNIPASSIAKLDEYMKSK